MVEVYKVLKGDIEKPPMLDTGAYRLTPDGYLLHLDAITNKLATVIPTTKAHTLVQCCPAPAYPRPSVRGGGTRKLYRI